MVVFSPSLSWIAKSERGRIMPGQSSRMPAIKHSSHDLMPLIILHFPAGRPYELRYIDHDRDLKCLCSAPVDCKSFRGAVALARERKRIHVAQDF